MSSYGVLSAGFVEKTLEDILEEIEDAEKAAFGAGTDVAPDAPLGQLNGIFGDKLAEIWEVVGAVYRAFYPDSASGASLDDLAALTGTIRAQPTSTVVALLLNLDPGTTVPISSVVRNSVTGARFVTTTVGSNAGADPTGISVQAEAEETGPVPADQYAIDEIVTPVSGWVAQAAIDSGSAGPYSLSFNDTLLVKVDNGTTQTLTFEATAAVLDSGNTQPYALVNGQTLDVAVDGAPAATATFNTGDFVDITQATAAEVAAVIATDIPGVTAEAAANGVRITSSSLGATSELEVTGGTANGALGFSGVAVFGAQDFPSFASVSASEMATAIDTKLVGGEAADLTTGVVRVQSSTDGAGSSIEFTGGTANSATNFPLVRVAGLNQDDEDLLGTDLETDSELRLRRQNELRAQGNATFEAILADVFRVPGVEDVALLENDSEVVDAFGLPPHSFEVILTGPSATDADIAQSIFETKAAGIQAFGSTVETVTDSIGGTHDIGFTRATEVPIYAEIDITTNTDPSAGPLYPSDGDEQVKAAIVAKGDRLGIGDDVIFEAIKCGAFDVDGVIDITAFFIDTITPPVGGSNIPIDPRERAVFDISRVTVNS